MLMAFLDMAASPATDTGMRLGRVCPILQLPACLSWGHSENREARLLGADRSGRIQPAKLAFLCARG